MTVIAFLWRVIPLACVAGSWALLSACGSVPVGAPVEARGTPPVAKPIAVGSGATPQRAAASSPDAGSSSASSAGGPGALAGPSPARLLPGAENAGKPGYYTVRPGDTLIRVGLDHGHNWRDVARWNAMDNPNLIEVGQVLRVLPPGVDAGSVGTRGAGGGGDPARSGPQSVASPATVGASPPGVPSAVGATPVVSTVAVASPGSPELRSGPGPVLSTPDESIDWAWPAAGSLVAGFDEARGVKGLSIAGKAGDAVLAAADGRVVYAGSGLRGYGNLVIVKHNGTYLTAYAHNQALLVKEDQTVRRGQKIAEMGSTDAERVKLHFEVRRQGRPVDPARLLPER